MHVEHRINILGVLSLPNLIGRWHVVWLGDNRRKYLVGDCCHETRMNQESVYNMVIVDWRPYPQFGFVLLAMRWRRRIIHGFECIGCYNKIVFWVSYCDCRWIEQVFNGIFHFPLTNTWLGSNPHLPMNASKTVFHRIYTPYSRVKVNSMQIN